MFFKNQDKSYTMTDLYLNHNMFFGYKDSYNYYDIDVNKILLFVKSDNEYIIRYNDVNKKKIVPLQLKINNFCWGELQMFTNNITLEPIHSDDKELFRKCWEIWNKITELIGINNPTDFVETILYDDDKDEFIMLKIEKIQAPLEINIEMILHLFFIMSLMNPSNITSSIQILICIDAPINHINKNKIKNIQSMHAYNNYYKNFFLFSFNI